MGVSPRVSVRVLHGNGGHRVVRMVRVVRGVVGPTDQAGRTMAVGVVDGGGAGHGGMEG